MKWKFKRLWQNPAMKATQKKGSAFARKESRQVAGSRAPQNQCVSTITMPARPTGSDKKRALLSGGVEGKAEARNRYYF